MDIYIRGLELPPKVKGVTVEDADGNFNVYVNTLLCEEAIERTYTHELRHIELMHFQDFNPVVINELEAATR